MPKLSRRHFLRSAGAAVVATAWTPARASPKGQPAMYGLISQFTAVQGQRDALIDVLLEGAAGMPGCLSYVVSKDAADPDVIWVTEVWDSRASHEASLSLHVVRQAMDKGRPLIAAFGDRFETEPMGGQGLDAVGA